MNELCIESLHVHPVKSTAVQDAKAMVVTADGAEGDRRFALIDEAGHAITARDMPKLVLVKADITEGGLRLSGPGMEDLEVHAEEHALARVTIWADAVENLSLHEEASAWFTRYLGRGCRLVRVGPESSRTGPLPKNPNAFQDAAPLLVVSAASLTDVNARLDQPVTMAHFRPNIVVSGAPAFDEDSWGRFRIGDVVLEGVWGSARCVFTTIDPATATKLEKGEPLRTMATHRQGNDNQVYFGQNTRVVEGGTIRVGDTIEVLTRLPGLVSQGDYIASLKA